MRALAGSDRIAPEPYRSFVETALEQALREGVPAWSERGPRDEIWGATRVAALFTVLFPAGAVGMAFAPQLVVLLLLGNVIAMVHHASEREVAEVRWLRRRIARYPLPVGALLLGLASAVGLLPYAAPMVDVVLLGATLPWWVPIAVVGLVAAALAYSLGVAGIARMGERLSSFVSLSEVLFAVVLAGALLGEVPSPIQLVGGVLIVGGVVLVRLAADRIALAVEGVLRTRCRETDLLEPFALTLAFAPQPVKILAQGERRG